MRNVGNNIDDHASRTPGILLRRLFPVGVDAIDARLERLRERLKNGDPDMTSDQLQATIERVEAKRRELTHVATRSVASDGARIISLLPKAAEYYGEQIALGLDGGP